jgi:hypothetical protein
VEQNKETMDNVLVSMFRLGKENKGRGKVHRVAVVTVVVVVDRKVH